MRTIGVAISIPEPFATVLDRHRREAGDPLAEFIPPHVTLLGPTRIEESDLSEVEAHLTSVAAQHQSFDVHLRGTGTFRPVTAVVFVQVAKGISECEQLQLAARTGKLATVLKFPYHPHVTVAHDVSDAQLDAVYDKLADFDATFHVDGFTLFEHCSDGRWRPRSHFPFCVGKRKCK